MCLFAATGVLLGADLCVAGGIATLPIPAVAIDLDRAHGLDGDVEPQAGHPQPVRRRELLNHTPLTVFTLSVMLFHFANAPLLPFVGQKLAAAYPREATAIMSSRIIAALSASCLRPHSRINSIGWSNVHFRKGQHA